MPLYPSGVRFVDSFGRPVEPIRVERMSEQDHKAVEEMRQRRASKAYKEAHDKIWDHRVKFRDFDASDHFGEPETMATYLTEALDAGDLESITSRLVDMARAAGMKQLAADIKGHGDNPLSFINHQFTPGLDKTQLILGAFGLRLTIQPVRRS